MKRFLALLLAVLMLISFASCDEGTTSKKKKDDTEETETTQTQTNTEEKRTEGVPTTQEKPETAETEEDDWADGIRKRDFENVTVEMKCTFISGYDSEEESFSVVKIDDGKYEVDDMLMDDEDSIGLLKDAYLGTLLAVVENDEYFVFDEDANCYASTREISFDVTFSGMDVTITLAEGTLAGVLSSGKLGGVVTEMTQSFTQDGEDVEYVMKVYFTCSDYGTTEVVG